MENFSSSGMSLEEYVRVKADTLVVFSNEFFKEIKNGNLGFAKMYQESFYDLIEDLSSVTNEGKNVFDCVKEELSNRGMLLESLFPEDKYLDEDLAM